MSTSTAAQRQAPALALPALAPAPALPIEQYTGVNGVYLLAFTLRGTHATFPAIRERSRCGASHYCGWAQDIGHRLAEHQRGQGAKLTRAAILAGYQLALVRVWPHASRERERAIKNGHGLARVCPLCRFHIEPCAESIAPARCHAASSIMVSSERASSDGVSLWVPAIPAALVLAGSR